MKTYIDVAVRVSFVLISLCFGQAIALGERDEDSVIRLHGMGGTKIGNRIYFLRSGDKVMRENLYVLDEGNSVPCPLLCAGDARRYVRRDRLYVDPSRERVAFDGGGEFAHGYDAANALVAADTSSSHVTVLVENGRYNCEPAFSPDGNRLAYYSARPNILADTYSTTEGFTLRVKDLNSGEDKEVGKAGFSVYSPTCPPAWSSDGKQIVFLMAYMPRGVQVCAADVDSGAIRVFNETERLTARALCFPDPERVLFTADGGKGIYELRLSNGKVRVKRPGPFCHLSLSPDRRDLSVGKIGQAGGITYCVIDSTSLEESTGGLSKRFINGWRYPGKGDPKPGK